MLAAPDVHEAERRAAHPLATGGVVVARGVMVAAPPEPETARQAARLSQVAMVALRRHPHLNNVLTHICGADWSRLEAALRAVFDPETRPRALAPLALNLLDLMCAERGVTGRIMKPYLHDLIAARLPPAEATAMVARIDALFLQAQNWRRI